MASPLIWTKELSVNVEEIDNQHKKLISIANTLLEHIENKTADDTISSILDELIDYTKYHFETEEKYFEQYDYEHAATHAQQHAIFVSKIKSFKRKFVKKELHISDKVLVYLRKWFFDHIIVSDKKYAPLLSEKLH